VRDELDLRQRLFEAIRSVVEDVPTIHDSSRLVEDLGISSLQAALILIETAEAAGISLSEIEAISVETVRDLLTCLSSARAVPEVTETRVGGSASLLSDGEIRDVVIAEIRAFADASLDSRQDFFALGLSSLDLTVLAYRLSEALGREISVVEVLENPSPHELARVLTARS
jgi:acyl carrier protein